MASWVHGLLLTMALLVVVCLLALELPRGQRFDYNLFQHHFNLTLSATYYY